MPLCAFLWVFGAVALCHAWSPALSSRVLKLGGLVMFREKERERERKCSVVHIVCSFSQLEFQPLPACLCSSLLKYLCLCCRHVCFHHGCICLSQYSIQSPPSTFQSDWLKCCRMLPWCPVMCQYFVQHCSEICAAESIILIYRFSLSTFVESHFNWNLLLTLLQSALGYSAFFCCWIFFSHLLLFLSAINPNACRATGRGLQPTGVRVKEVADFKVFTKGAGSGALSVSVKGPSESDSSVLCITPPRAFLEWFPLFGSFVCIHIRVWYGTKQQNEMHKMRLSWYYSFSAGAEEQVKVRDVGNGVYECEYYPLKPGKYTVTITWGGQPIPRR